VRGKVKGALQSFICRIDSREGSRRGVETNRGMALNELLHNKRDTTASSELTRRWTS
jgi:hypothetical protein